MAKDTLSDMPLDPNGTATVDNKADSQPEELVLNKPPDGGWGWVVVFGSFMIHVIADGVAYSFGIYVESFLVHFEASRSEVGFLGSLMLGVTWGTGESWLSVNFYNLINFVLFSYEFS